MVVEAAWGLGEMIVGGYVTPDSYVVNKRDGSLIDVNVSEQMEMMIRSAEGNTRVPVSEKNKSIQKLSIEQISEISTICQKIETHYSFPCDIEWAMEGGHFYIVQSRPITTLKTKTL